MAKSHLCVYANFMCNKSSDLFRIWRVYAFHVALCSLSRTNNWIWQHKSGLQLKSIWLQLKSSKFWNSILYCGCGICYQSTQFSSTTEWNRENLFIKPRLHYKVFGTARLIFWHGCRFFSARHGKFWQCKRCRLGTRAEIFSHSEHYQIRRSRHSYWPCRASFYASVNAQPCRAVEKISVRSKDGTRARSGANF